MANKPKYLEFDDIRKYTDNFSLENFISRCTYGRVFRGRIGDQECTVKIWDNAVLGGKRGRCELFQELILPRWNNFKGIPKVVGSCDDENYPCAIVYDLKSMDTVHNLIPKDNFSWTNRIKVALGFALCLRSFHVNKRPFVIRNLDAAHIMCDQEYTPTLYEYGFLAGGPSCRRWKFDGRSGSPGYIDPYFTAERECSLKTDVFAYGIVLLGLITKKVANVESDTDAGYLDKWAESECSRKMTEKQIKNPILVEKSLRMDPHFNFKDGYKLTKLAMQCIVYEPDERPEMEEVVDILQTLKVVQMHGDKFGVNKVLSYYNNNNKSSKIS